MRTKADRRRNPVGARALVDPAEAGVMPNTPVDTVWLQQCVERWRAGDREAADSLFRGVGQRLEQALPCAQRTLRSSTRPHSGPYAG